MKSKVQNCEAKDVFGYDLANSHGQQLAEVELSITQKWCYFFMLQVGWMFSAHDGHGPSRLQLRTTCVESDAHFPQTYKLLLFMLNIINTNISKQTQRPIQSPA